MFATPEIWLNDTTPDGNWLYLPRPGNSEDEGPNFQQLLASSDLNQGSLEFSSDSAGSEAPDRFDEGLENYLDGSQPGHHFRIILDPERINPMLVALARAKQHTPNFQRMALYTGDGSCGLEVTYLAAGQDIDSLCDEDEGVRALPWNKKRLIAQVADLAKRRWHILLESAWKDMGSPGDEIGIRIDRCYYGYPDTWL
jgi:hypothetical protein